MGATVGATAHKTASSPDLFRGPIPAQIRDFVPVLVAGTGPIGIRIRHCGRTAFSFCVILGLDPRIAPRSEIAIFGQWSNDPAVGDPRVEPEDDGGGEAGAPVTCLA